jgi:glutamine---fructose-6-phosphate transaminase (isomerizing)
MCGIVAYVGDRTAYPILIKGLQRLEYRGYDSAGIALLNGKTNVYKCKGKVKDLQNLVKDKEIDGTIGMGHTRWATHGEPNDVNAHPHLSMNGKFHVVHNGIIENYAHLKRSWQIVDTPALAILIQRCWPTLLKIFTWSKR